LFPLFASGIKNISGTGAKFTTRVVDMISKVNLLANISANKKKLNGRVWKEDDL
jgi:hypothetical protein